MSAEISVASRSNDEQRRGYEINSFQEFQDRILSNNVDDIRSFVLRRVDFSPADDSVFHKLQVSGTSSTEAINRLLAGKTVVSIMGGMSLQRSSPIYSLIVRTSWKLAKAGFVVATGGGAGAMEAGNLGAYLANRTEVEVEEALQLITSEESAESNVWDSCAQSVISRFGPAKDMPSVGLHSFALFRPNLFASLHSKHFSHPVREDLLLQASNGGVVFTTGGLITRQELFQAATINLYAKENKQCPIVFMGSDGWSAGDFSSLLDQIEKFEQCAPWIVRSDAPDEVVAALISHATSKKLPLAETPLFQEDSSPPLEHLIGRIE